MKLNHALKASYIAISCAILSSTMPVSASNSNPFGFNKADSILSDMAKFGMTKEEFDSRIQDIADFAENEVNKIVKSTNSLV